MSIFRIGIETNPSTGMASTESECFEAAMRTDQSSTCAMPLSLEEFILKELDTWASTPIPRFGESFPYIKCIMHLSTEVKNLASEDPILH